MRHQALHQDPLASSPSTSTASPTPVVPPQKMTPDPGVRHRLTPTTTMSLESVPGDGVMALALFKVVKNKKGRLHFYSFSFAFLTGTVTTTTAAPQESCQVLRLWMHTTLLKEITCSSRVIFLLLFVYIFQCGVKGGDSNTRIVGGRETKEHEYPWQVNLE